MKPEKAIRKLQYDYNTLGKGIPCNMGYGTAIDEAYNMAILALEKQIPKKPDVEGDSYDKDGNIIYDTWRCPCCRSRYEVEYDDYAYCPECGQKLDMSDVSI